MSHSPEPTDDPFLSLRFWLFLPLAVVASTRSILGWLLERVASHEHRITSDALDVFVDLDEDPAAAPDDVWYSIELQR